MAKIEGKTKAALEWAKEWPQLDGYLKLNALITEDGEATFNTAYNDVAVDTYNDGTAKRQYTFQLRIMAPWSDGYDPVNIQAEQLAASWLDWVSEQYELGNLPEWEGVEFLSIEPAQNAPALNAVYKDESLAEYMIQAIITYVE